jgi:hypothetical protein
MLSTSGELGVLTLGWIANPDPDLAGYNIYYGSSSGHYGEPITIPLASLEDANNPSWDITGLGDGTLNISITAYNVYNLESAHSTEIWVTMPSGVIVDMSPPVFGLSVLGA